MLAFGNKEFRNLQEQVLENMRQIDDIKQAAVVLDEFGIKVIGQIESADDLPDPETYEGEFGDAYAVGTEAPYELYIWTRGDSLGNNAYWFDIGAFPQAGPQGQQGAQGEQGPSGTISFGTITTTTLQPGQSASVTATNVGTASNAVYNMSFAIPQGAQGIPGETGATGATGATGPQGPKGDKGDTGTGYIIMGQLDSALDLPDPGATDRQAAYLIGTNEPYDLYVIVGTIGHLEWFDAGPFTTSQADINQFEAGTGLTLSEVNSKIEYAIDNSIVATHTDIASAINSLSSSIASIYATQASLASFQSDVNAAFSSVYASITSQAAETLADAETFTMSYVANLSSVYAGLNSNNDFAGNNIFTGTNSFSRSIGLLSGANLVVADSNQSEYAINIPRISGTMALTSDIPSISASYSGSYWTEMTLNGVTKEFGAGSSGGDVYASGTNTFTGSNTFDSNTRFNSDNYFTGATRFDTSAFFGNGIYNDYKIYANNDDLYITKQYDTNDIYFYQEQDEKKIIIPFDKVGQYETKSLLVDNGWLENWNRIDFGAVNTKISANYNIDSIGYLAIMQDDDTNNRIAFVNEQYGQLSSAIIVPLNSMTQSIETMATREWVNGAFPAPTSVSGTHNNSYWTSITIDNDTYSIPSGGTSYSAGDWISLSNNTISVYNPYVSLMSNSMPRILMATSTTMSQGVSVPSFTSAAYVNINPANGFQVNDRRSLSTNAYTTYGHDAVTFNNAYALSFPLASGYFVAATNLSNSAMSAETWTFTLSDMTTVTKKILVG